MSNVKTDIKEGIEQIPELVNKLKSFFSKEQTSALLTLMEEGEEWSYEKCVEASEAECGECVCTAIENGAIDAMIESGFASDKADAIEKLTTKFNEDEVARTLITRKPEIKEPTFDAESAFKAVTDLVEAQHKSLEAQAQRIAELTERFNASSEPIAELKSMVEKLSAEPSAEPTKAKDGVKKNFETPRPDNGGSMLSKESIAQFRSQNGI